MNTPQIDDGGPAFPHTHESWHTYPKGEAQPPPGMTLRDWFAGQAIRTVEARLGTFNPDIIADRCYELADAMISARKYNP